REREQTFGVGGKRSSFDGLDWSREPAVRVGGSHTDRLGAEVEAKQRTAPREMRSGLDKWKDECRHGAALATETICGQESVQACKKWTRVPQGSEAAKPSGISFNVAPVALSRRRNPSRVARSLTSIVNQSSPARLSARLPAPSLCQTLQAM